MSASLEPHPILAAWQSVLATKAHAPAILDASGAVLKTFGQLEEEAQNIQKQLASIAVGEVLGVQMGAGSMLPALLLAAWRANICPLLVDSSYTGETLDKALQTTGAVRIARREKDLSIAPLCNTPLPLPPGTALLKLTSGTTGNTKAIPFRAAQLLADCDNVCETMGIGADDLNYGVIPWAHSYGFSNLVTPLLCRGIPVVATEDRLPRAILNGLQNTGATVFPGVPVLFRKLADLDTLPLPRLRLCISAGAPMPSTISQSFARKYGLKIHNFYGSSECGGIAYDATETLDIPDGTVGQPMRGVSIQMDSDSRIRIRSAAVADGYFPAADSESLQNGEFIPGDLLESTPQGLRIIGRVSEFINVAGRKLNPIDVETQLRNCPHIRECIVFGVPNDLRGEEPIACVVADPASIDSIRQYCRETLPSWQIPRDIWVLDNLPINERGKISRAALGKMYLGAKL